MNTLYTPAAALQLVQRPGAVIGKGGNPHQYLVDGEKYQRVTTILDKTIPKPQLISWATRTGVEKMAEMLYEAPDEIIGMGLDFGGYINILAELAKAEPDRVKDEAADWGTEAHQTIQGYIESGLHSRNTYEAPFVYRPTLDAFYKLQFNLEIRWRATEMIVWSNTLRVAGTVDAVGQLPDGSWILMDWKTGEWKPEWVKKYKSGFFWPEENALQLAAYAAMFTEVTGHPVSQAWVVRFPRNQPEAIPCVHCCNGFVVVKAGVDDYDQEPCPHCEGSGQSPPPGFEARQVANLESTALHYGMLVDHFRWLKQSLWVEA